MQPAKISSPALTVQEYKRHEKNRLTVRRLPSNYKFARKADLPQSAISILYYYSSFCVIVNLPPDAKPLPRPQCRGRYPQLKRTLPDYG